jgi:Ca2+-binding RTX toxin-like protein
MTDASVVEGNLATPVDLTNAVSTLHQFIIDIAHNANPFADTTGALGIPDGVADTILTADANTTTDAVFAPLAPGEYDNELLDAHFIAGDGRVNENIALTAVHHVFHSEHNRMVAQVKNTIAASGDLAFINEWLLDDITTLPVDQAAIDDLVANGSWDGERLFQVAKFSTEMQYQHLVFEEFARTIQPTVDPFFAATQVYDIDIDPSIVAEFAHTVYRFGHSMLTETVDRLDANFASSEIGLIQAFLNPTEFDASGTLSAEEAAGAIARGVTRQVGNEIDEFVTTALRNNLLGLPLDLAAINIARGRDTGIPSLNNARAQFFAATQDTQLKPYESWVEFMENIKHPESIINFIAAYGTHNTITGATTLADKRAAATLLVLGGAGEPTDRFDFLHATGTWDGIETGLNLVDFWIGGLAEAKEPFGGFLGSTFNFVFEYQMEVLQNADRFYYLERTAGLPFLTALEANSFARMITANTNATHLPGNVFLTPAYTLEVDQSQQYTGLGPDGRADPTGGIEIGGTELLPLVLRGVNSLEYTGGDHVVLGGTANNDTIISSIGDDTIYGDGGDDNLEGGYGNDTILGGAGDDVLTDIGGDDLFQGEDGNDVIQGGNGVNLIIGGAGNDFIILGEDANEGFGGFGTDFILGTRNTEATFGGEGDDWIEAGTTDGGSGDNFDPLGADPVPGNDIFIGRGENDKFQAEGGDDIMFGSPGMGDRYIGGSGFDWASFKSISETFLWGVNQGVTIDIRGRFFDQPVAPGGPNALSRFDIVEGLSGSSFADYLQGDDEDATSLRTAGALGSVLTQLDLIEGLRTFVETALGGPVDFFDGGNIIFGGAGSDILEGRGGDDLLDGDRWLDVYISVRENNDGTGAEIAAFESMVPLVPLMLDRVYNPGQLTIQRIIRDDDDSFDTAVFTGLLSEYTISTVGGVTTVTDLSLTPRDGTDRLINIEKLQFADQAVILNGAGNNVATGSLAFIDDTTEVPNLTPSTGDVLRVTLGTVADLDGIVSTYRIAYFWQVENVPGSGVFTDIEVDAAGEFARVRGDTFEVTDAYEGLRLRVRAVFVDGEGNLEEVYTPASKAVNAPATGAPAISDTTPTVGFAITANPGTIADPNGLITAVFTYQWQQGVVGGGGPFTNIVGATGASFTPTAAQGNRQLRVVATFTDDDGNLESRASAAAITGVNVLLDPGNDTFTGTGGQDIINGEGGNDTLNGGAEDDQLIGGAGNDMLTGGTGADTMTGGAGDDIFQVENAGDVVVENANEGIDQVRASITYTLGANVENLQLTGAAAINGTGNGLNNVIVGNSAANVLSGLGGDDTIQGGGGADTYIGGTGNDIYIVANAGITITEAANEGTDTVRASVTTTLSADVENLVLTGTADINGTGNGLNNTINGNNGVNVIQGNDGNDTINAAGGNDIINGGAGDDVILGGSGNDQIQGGAGEDRIGGGAGNDIMNGGAGNDIFVFIGSFGNDEIRQFDPNPVGGQDLIDLTGLGVTAANFNATVTITDTGPDVLITVGGAGTILLVNIANSALITQADFILL